MRHHQGQRGRSVCGRRAVRQHGAVPLRSGAPSIRPAVAPAHDAGNALVGVVIGLCVWFLPLFALVVPAVRPLALALLGVYGVVLVGLAVGRARRLLRRRATATRSVSAPTLH